MLRRRRSSSPEEVSELGSLDVESLRLVEVEVKSEDGVNGSPKGGPNGSLKGGPNGKAD